MAVFRKQFSFRMSVGEVRDISEEVASAIEVSGINEGICNVFALGSTAAVITTEYEEGHLSDLFSALEVVAPSGKEYEHHKAWHDDNGKSHVRAAFLQQDLTFPISNGKPLLGTWQAICLVNLDTKKRDRSVVITVLGE